jgi:lactoylglutathione lyase
MRYLHTMLRVRDLDAALDFFCGKLGLVEVSRRRDEKGRYTNVFLAAPRDKGAGGAVADSLPAGRDAPRDNGAVADSLRAGRDAPLLELTYNWDAEDYGEARYFGHLAFEVDDIHALCERLMKAGVAINRPPRDGMMAFVRSPDRQSIELLQKGEPLPPREPWTSMPNTGRW